jgi:hypothetical protein
MESSDTAKRPKRNYYHEQTFSSAGIQLFLQQGFKFNGTFLVKQHMKIASA